MALDDPYVTPDDLIDHLAITARDHDDALARVAVAGSRWVDGYCDRQFNLAATATARYFDPVNGLLFVDDIGDDSISVASDTAADGTYATAWATTDFQADPVNAITNGEPITELVAVGSYTWPTDRQRRGLVRVTARWGWPEVPEAVKQATLMQASRLFKRRESVEGVLGGGDFGVVRVGSRVDPDVADLLERYRRVRVG